jgi:predicted O-methyltransferase YrrM
MLPLINGLEFYLKADTVFSSQSMLFYQFYREVLKDEALDSLDWLEEERKNFLEDPTEFERKDLGAGGQKGKISIKRIARTALSTPLECRRLYRLARFLKPKATIELGTSLGLSSAYIISGHPDMNYLGVEGDPFLADQATKLLAKVENIQTKVLKHTIEDTLAILHQKGEKFDLVYMDGHHEFEATLTYFEKIIEILSDNAMVVVDDILWSGEMLNAWQEVRRHPQVTASLSYMGVGYLFFSEKFLAPVHEDWVHIHLKPWTSWWSW